MNRRSFLQGATALFASLLAGPEQLGGPTLQPISTLVISGGRKAYSIGIDHGRPSGDWVVFRNGNAGPKTFTYTIVGRLHSFDGPVRMGELAIEEVT